MKNKKMFMVMLIALAVSFIGCSGTETVDNSATKEVETSTQDNSQEDTTTEENTTEENITEENTTEENTTEENTTEETTEKVIEDEKNLIIEYTCDENNIPAEMIENVKGCTEYEMGAYLYGDIDRDEEQELLAAYLDESVGQWKIMRLENETAEPVEFHSVQLPMYLDKCDLKLIVLKDKIHYVINLYPSMGIGSGSQVFEETESGINVLLDCGNTYWQDETGDVIVQGAAYGERRNKFTGDLEGRIWRYSYLKYDEESGQYKEYVAKEITEEEFLTYEGAAECLEKIKNSYTDYEVKYTFFRRSNGLMHIHCEYEDETYIYYEGCVIEYEDNTITYVNEMMGAGEFIGKFFGDLEEM